MVLNQKWDLDAIFVGGSQSAELEDFLSLLDQDITRAKQTPLPNTLRKENIPDWTDTIQNYFDLSARVQQVNSFARCLVSQDVQDIAARNLTSHLNDLTAQIEILWAQLYGLAATQSDENWDALLATAALRPVAFGLNENRNLARQKMSPEKEALIEELAVNGYHAWFQLYLTTMGMKQVPFKSNGEVKRQSLGQLLNTFLSNPDRKVRRDAFEAFNAAWGELAPTSAMALNCQAGFRLTLYKHRGWDSILKGPLFDNRVGRQTLDTMWDVINGKSDKLIDYLAAKAKLLGVEKLHWYDLAATVGEQTRTMTYTEAADFVVENIRPFNPDIADFCRMALDERWIESEDRPGKQGGGYMVNFPLNGQSRIFMIFDGSPGSAALLAHELGHAYHERVLFNLPYGARRYGLSVAETASTFNERIIADASLRAATDDQERLSLLGHKLDSATYFFMNMRACYDFERAFFDRRAKGHLSVNELSDLMLEKQKAAFYHALAGDGYYPLYWAGRLHFYIIKEPFYHFPYTFGYLLSNAVYAQAMQEGPAFRERYIALLRDTGSMDVETLAQTHLGVDLSQPDFWETAVERVLSEVDEFVALADKVTHSN